MLNASVKLLLRTSSGFFFQVLAEIVYSLMKLAIYDPITMSCNGIQRLVCEAGGGGCMHEFVRVFDAF